MYIIKENELEGLLRRICLTVAMGTNNPIKETASKKLEAVNKSLNDCQIKVANHPHQLIQFMSAHAELGDKNLNGEYINIHDFTVYFQVINEKDETIHSIFKINFLYSSKNNLIPECNLVFRTGFLESTEYHYKMCGGTTETFVRKITPFK